jgi:hypothetical protein
MNSRRKAHKKLILRSVEEDGENCKYNNDNDER